MCQVIEPLRFSIFPHNAGSFLIKSQILLGDINEKPKKIPGIQKNVRYREWGKSGKMETLVRIDARLHMFG